VIFDRIGRHFRERDKRPWRTAAEATMSLRERDFVEESAENRDWDMVTRASFGGGNPNRLLDFPDDHERR
jgi:hypothetical protein